MIYCYNCGCHLSKPDFCTSCGADVTLYKKVMHISNMYYNEGLEKAGVRDLTGAVVSLRQSLKFNKNNLKARNLLGLVYFEMGEVVTALSEWVISKNIRPEKNIADEYIEKVRSNSTRLESINQTIKKYNRSLALCCQGSKDLAVISVDIASLSQETLDNIKVATLGDSNDMELGEQVVAIGNALGYGQSVTTGIVSALGRSVSTQGADGQTEGLGSENRYIQTDAAINPGNSGGAMFNMKGELVGINSAKSAGEYVEGMGYAIPISDIKEDMERMMQQETRTLLAENERGYLGISVSNATSEINEAYDIPLGAHISSVTEGSPAERAGLQRGMVVTAINGKSVRTREELIEYLSYYKAGETVSFTVKVRTDAGYEDRNFDVTLYSAEEAGITTQENQVPGTDSNSGTEYVLPDGQNPFGGFFPFFND